MLYLPPQCHFLPVSISTPFYHAECLATETRAKGVAFGGLVSSISTTVGQYSSGTAVEAISYYYYLVFMVWDLVEFAIIYFFFVETKGRTLEEINELFMAPNPAKKSLEPKTDAAIENTLFAS